MEIEADEGKRIRLELFGENYYLGIFKTAEGFDFVPTVPRENDPRMSRERLAVETICRVLGRGDEAIKKRAAPLRGRPVSVN